MGEEREEMAAQAPQLPRTASDIMRPEHRRIRRELAAQIVALLAEPENPDVGWGIYYDLLGAAFPTEAQRARIAEQLRSEAPPQSPPLVAPEETSL